MAASKGAVKSDETKGGFGTFELLAGTHNTGAAIHGTRKRAVGRNPAKGRANGDVIHARSEKEAEFMRRYPDKYREINMEMRGERERFGETATPRPAPRPSRPPHMTDDEPSLLSPVLANPGEGTDNDGAGDDAGDKGEVKKNKESEEVEEVDLDKLKAMPVRELLVWARNHNVDIKGAIKKDDILKNIESALSDNS